MNTPNEDRIAQMLRNRATDVMPDRDESLLSLADRVQTDHRRASVWRPLVAVAAAGALVAGAVVGVQVLRPTRIEVSDPDFASSGGASQPATTTEGWTRLPVDGDIGRGRPAAAAAAGDTIVVVGQGESGRPLPVVWRSADGGTSWVRSDALLGSSGAEYGEALDVTVDDGVFRAVGHLDWQAYAWTSFDGGDTWVAEALTAPGSVEMTVARGVARDDAAGLTVVVGEVQSGGQRSGGVWVSDGVDGIGAWTFEADEPSFAPDPETVLYEVDRLPEAGSFIARGYGPESTGNVGDVWISPDGRDWRLQGGTSLAGQNIDAVTLDDRGFLVAVSVATGGSTSSMVQRSSDFAETWQPWGEGFDLLPPAGGSNPRVADLVRIAGRFYAPGSFDRAGGGRTAAMWVDNLGVDVDYDHFFAEGETLTPTVALEVLRLGGMQVLLIGMAGGDETPTLAVWVGTEDQPAD